MSDFGFAKEDDGSLMTPHFTPYYVAPQVTLVFLSQQVGQQCTRDGLAYSHVLNVFNFVVPDSRSTDQASPPGLSNHERQTAVHIR